MAVYNTQYRMEFMDRLGLSWQVDFLLKDGPVQTEPLSIVAMDDPVIVEWTAGDAWDVPVVPSRVDISYLYQEGGVHPETFINIQERDWVIETYRAGVLWWKGFIKPDKNSYPWLYPPYPFTLNAVDFTFSKTRPMNLNGADGLLLYDHITVADMLRRTLFFSVGYDNPILKILYSLTPTPISGDPITDLLVHTDAFYTLDDGADFCYDALSKWAYSLGARFVYSAGSYWLQRLQEVDSVTQDVTIVTPDVVTAGTNFDSVKELGSSPSAVILYHERSQVLSVDVPIKQQDGNYKLKAINQISNFDWRGPNTVTPFPGWEGDTSGDGTFTRIGTGSQEDVYKLRIVPVPPATTRQIWARIAVIPGQILEVNFRGENGINANYLQVYAYLVPQGSISAEKRLDEGGNWIDAAGNSTDAMNLSFNVNSNNGNLTVVSQPVPQVGVGAMEALILIGHLIPHDGLSPGDPVSVDLYPVFARIFTSYYSDIENKIASNLDYSYKPEIKEMFFMDTLDARLSNTIFYDNAGPAPIPDNSWSGKSIEENTARMMLDEYYRPVYKFEGSVYTNQLSFHNSIRLADKENRIMILTRDRYSIRSCVHDITAVELKSTGSGVGVYSELPIRR